MKNKTMAKTTQAFNSFSENGLEKGAFEVKFLCAAEFKAPEAPKETMRAV